MRRSGVLCDEVKVGEIDLELSGFAWSPFGCAAPHNAPARRRDVAAFVRVGYGGECEYADERARIEGLEEVQRRGTHRLGELQLDEVVRIRVRVAFRLVKTYECAPRRHTVPYVRNTAAST